MKTLKKNSFVGMVLSLTLLLVLFTSSAAEGATFSQTDPTNDVTKMTYELGNMTSLTENVAKPEIDITNIEVTWNPSMTQNSTISMTFAGTPVMDEYHSYLTSFNLTIQLNATHYFIFGVSLIAGAFSDASGQTQDINPWIIYVYSLKNASGVDVTDDWGLPVMWGFNTQDISYSVSGNTITFSFGLSSADSDFVDAASGASSTTLNELEAWSYVGDDPFLDYTNNSGTLWVDNYPNDANDSSGTGNSDNGSSDGNDSTGSENDTAENNPLAALTPGYVAPLSLVALLSLGAMHVIQKRRRLN